MQQNALDSLEKAPIPSLMIAPLIRPWKFRRAAETWEKLSRAGVQGFQPFELLQALRAHRGRIPPELGPLPSVNLCQVSLRSDRIPSSVHLPVLFQSCSGLIPEGTAGVPEALWSRRCSDAP